MVAFLFALSIAMLIAVGVAVSLYLYRQGVIGERYTRRLRYVHTFVVEPATKEVVEDEYYMNVGSMNGDSMYSETTNYARAALLVLLGCGVVIILLVLAIINAALH